MATLLYLRGGSTYAQISRGTNTNNQRGNSTSWTAYALTTYPFTSSGYSLTCASINGPTAGVEFGGSTIAYEWISEPLFADVTIEGTISLRFCGSQSNALANGSPSFRIDRLDSTGTIVSTVLDTNYGTALTTTQAAYTWTATPTSTNFKKGDRIRIIPYIDDNATTGNMVAGYTFTMNYDSTNSNSNTTVQFTENLIWANVAFEKKIIASDAGGSQFGCSVACSSDGSKIVVGSYNSSVGGVSFSGAVYVYSGTNYTTEKKLSASDRASSDQFGSSVACSSDGTVIVVGASQSDPGGTSNAGAVYVYSGSNYATVTKLVASDKAPNDYFGYSVACSSDGSVIVVGAYVSDPGGISNAGAVYIYSGNNWSTETKLSASDKAINNYFGWSVSSSSDGSVIVVGARGASPGGVSNAGAAYVYSGANYTTETKLVASDKTANSLFGISIDCSSDGTTVLVGASQSSGAGAAYVYSGITYATEQKILNSDRGGGDLFGCSVSSSSDGSVIVVGAKYHYANAIVYSGALYVYSDTNYANEIKIAASEKYSSAEFGTNVTCSSDGRVIIAGAPGVNYAYRYSTPMKYYLTDTVSDIVNQGTDERKVWTVR